MWQEYLLFLAKVATLVVAIALVVGVVGSSIAQARADQSSRKPPIRIRKINQEIEERAEALKAVFADTPQGVGARLRQLWQQWVTRRAEKAHAEEKAVSPEAELEQPEGSTTDSGPSGGDDKPVEITEKTTESGSQTIERDRVFLLRFAGDIRATAVDSLREEITAILQIARPQQDRVLLVLDSPGGVVPGYGLAAAQLTRLRDAEIELTVAVDRVAASGGYMMAAVANRIVAAPFAIVGSIGVVAQLPNINRMLKKHDVDVELHTAGEYKRTLTFLGENTDEGREKFKEDLEQTHGLFKQFLSRYRPGLNMEKVATGEHWLGEDALALNLVDAIATSDDLILEEIDRADVYELTQPAKKRGLLGKLNATAQSWLSTWHKA